MGGSAFEFQAFLLEIPHVHTEYPTGQRFVARKRVAAIIATSVATGRRGVRIVKRQDINFNPIERTRADAPPLRRHLPKVHAASAHGRGPRLALQNRAAALTTPST